MIAVVRLHENPVMPEPVMKCRSRLCDAQFDKRLLRCPSCGMIGVEKLYKYRSFSGNHNTNDILTKRSVWFPSAHNLNDPFEFSFNFRVMSVNGVKIDRASLEVAKSTMKNYGVFSLSEPNDNILMWTHYADEHRGICLEFTRSETNTLGNPEHCVPVCYSNEVPTFMPLELQEKPAVSKVLTTKGLYWEYEAEWRVISHQSNVALPFPGDLTGVIFGFAMPQIDRDAVISKLGRTVRYFETTKSSSYYALDVTPVDI